MKTFDELVSILCREYGYDGEYLRSKTWEQLNDLYNIEFMW